VPALYAAWFKVQRAAAGNAAGDAVPPVVPLPAPAE
jgi:hypothetical protein